MKDIKLQKAEDGKGLSTNDYTTEEKNKLAGIETNATKYIHPNNHPPSIITQDSNNRFFTDAERTKLQNIATGATKTTVNNTLTSTSTTDALSAAQGKVLADGKAPKSHTHTITNVTGLQDALDSKLDEYTGTLEGYTGHYLDFILPSDGTSDYSRSYVTKLPKSTVNTLHFVEKKSQIATCIVETIAEYELTPDAPSNATLFLDLSSLNSDGVVSSIGNIRAIHVDPLNADIAAGFHYDAPMSVRGSKGNIKQITLWWRYLGNLTSRKEKLAFSITLIL